MKELAIIQSTLKAPKNLRNSFGGYNYRSCEGILEAVKPLLMEQGCFITLTDAMIPVANRVYVEATATITNVDGQSVSVKAYAREEETKKGMDAAQITGAASSYARKYALNGLFAIDDTKDPDTEEHYKRTHHEASAKPADPIRSTPPEAPRAKNRVTMDMLEDPVKGDCMLDWGYQRWTASNYAEDFDAGAALLRSFDADNEVVDRFRKLFNSYKVARKAPKNE